MNAQVKPQFRSGIYANAAHLSQGFMLMRNGDTVALALFGYKPDQSQFWATGSGKVIAADDGVAVSMYQVSGEGGGLPIANAILRPAEDGTIDTDCDFARSINGPAYRGNFKPLFYC